MKVNYYDEKQKILKAMKENFEDKEECIMLFMALVNLQEAFIEHLLLKLELNK